MSKSKQTWGKQNIVKLIPVVIFIGLSLFLHIYRISEVPRGIYIDEMAMAYDSWSLGNFGVERHLSSWPLYLNNCGGGQSVLYCYLDMPLLMIMGITPVAIRIPSIIFSMLACICGYRLIKRQLGYRAGVIYLALFTLVPYFTMAGRIGLDCNLMLGLSVLMLDVLHKAILSKKRSLYVWTGVIAGVTLYSYALSYLILPMFFVLAIAMLLWMRRIRIMDIVALLLPMVILGTPLLIVQIINLFDLPELKLGVITFTKQIDYRAGEVGFGHIWENVHGLYRCIFKTDISEFSNFKGYSNLYPVSVPFLALGAVLSIVKFVKNLIRRCFDISDFVTVYVGCVVAIALLLDGILTYRINSIFFGLAYMIVFAMEWLITTLKKWGIGICGLAAIAYIIYFGSFSNYYFNVYPDDIYPQRLFGENPVPALEYVHSLGDDIGNRRIFLGGINEAYLHYLAYTQTSPYDYDLEKNGNIGTDELVFYAPTPYDIHSNYVMYLPDEEEKAGLSELGFECTQMGPFYIYINY